MKYKVEILQDTGYETIEAEEGSVLMDVLGEKGYYIYSPCGGEGTCGKCLVHIRGKGIVAACRFKIHEDITVILQGEREMSVLGAQHEYTATMDFNPGQPALLSDKPVGCAVDIGTTTIVYYFIDLTNGLLMRTYVDINPQSNYGADVISRINRCVGDAGAVKKLHLLLVESVKSNINRFITDTGTEAKDITAINVVGNTTMLHFIAGVDPSPIAFSPFKPVFTDYRILNAREMGLRINAEAKINLLPSLSGYIGSDIIAGLASLQDSLGGLFLYTDIGTNGEVVLSSEDRIWACSTAAGPAFEGANISCGSLAAGGAICSYKDGKIKTIANSEPDGICGSGLVDIIAHMLSGKLVSPEGKINKPFVVYKKGKSRTISITQQDIREVQLAKAAVAAGINILLRRSGYGYGDVEKFIIAGGFGNYLDTGSAIKIGLFPEQLNDKLLQVGNAAGTGAVLSLKSEYFIDRINNILSRTEYLELSSNEDFMEKFVSNINFKSQTT
ncbi:MAG: DUF4445 domain-containing protein [Bacteroidales bacterium]|nr:DUF4445 domain-containing protein [Bacteroidales bacterium]